MDVKQYLDATYLKTPVQAGITDAQNREVVRSLVLESIHENYKLVMIRPDMVAMARYMIDEARSSVLVGTVVDFPGGGGGIELKLAEANEAIVNGANELDFVADYSAFVSGDIEKVTSEIIQCTKPGLDSNKVVKWIIEIAALTDVQIAQLTALIRDVVVANFSEKDYSRVFVKSSTGFYSTKDGKPNGATPEGIKIMLQNAGPLPVKAAGGVKNYRDAIAYINMGIKRIGTSSAKEIVHGGEVAGTY